MGEPPSWRWLVSSHPRGRARSARVCGPVGFYEAFTVSRWSVALAPTLTVCDLLIMIMVMGQLASFGLPWWRRAGRQTRDGVTPRVSAIVKSACTRPFVQSSVSPAGLVVKGPDQLLPGLPRRPIVCRCSPRSTSFVLAALRALQVDRCCARRSGQRSRNPVVRSGPTAGSVAGLVANHRVGDLVGTVSHRAANHTALLAAGPQLLAIPPGGRIAAP
jgi:hypothetical protein